MPEILLQYIWLQGLWKPFEQQTTDGRTVEILSPGKHNLGAGPDFSQAHIRINGIDCFGSVEIHIKSSDWFRHHHDRDSTYDHIILHVVREADKPVYNTHGEELPQCVLRYPDDQDYVLSLLEAARRMDSFPQVMRCYQQLATSPELLESSWLDMLLHHRMQCKRDSIDRLLQLTQSDWEAAFYISLSRNFGFHYNSTPFELMAMRTPLRYLRKHRDSLFQLSALLLGQAGLLSEEAAETDTEEKRLIREYRFLQAKYSLTPIDKALWKRGMSRPQNAPRTRVLQLAQILHEREFLFSAAIDAANLTEMRNLFLPTLGKASVDVLLINTVIPYRYAYSLWQRNTTRAEEAVQWLEAIPAEKNRIADQWRLLGQRVHSAADTQALIHLYQNFCQPQQCIHCGVGYQVFLSQPIL